MTKKLSELFNLTDTNEEISDETVLPDEQEAIPAGFITETMLDDIDKIETALPAVKGLEASDKEMDELAAKAQVAFDNLIDLGFQVDSRFASEIFNSASSMLGHAITAKVAKTNKKLKMIQLQLQKAELDRKLAAAAAKGEAATDTTPLGQGQVLDRTELIKQIMAQSKSASTDK
jgi:hypothetical protein